MAVEILPGNVVYVDNFWLLKVLFFKYKNERKATLCLEQVEYAVIGKLETL